MEDYVAEALQQGLNSQSPASTGFFFIEKKVWGGGLRPCIDYQGLNAITQHPLLLVPAAIDQLRGSTAFSKLDL